MKDIRLRLRLTLLIALGGLLLLASSSSWSQNVTSISGAHIALSVGSSAGVKVGMTGKLCTQMTAGEKSVESCPAIFEIVSVTGNSSTARITRGNGSQVTQGYSAVFKEPLLRSVKDMQRTTPVPARASAPLALVLTFKADSWIELFADDKLAFSGLMRRGETRAFAAKVAFRLTLGNAAAAVASLNGHELSPFGSAEQVLRDVFIDGDYPRRIATSKPSSTAIVPKGEEPETLPLSATGMPLAAAATPSEFALGGSVRIIRSSDWQEAPAFMIHFSSYQKRENADRDAVRLSRMYSRPLHVLRVDLGRDGVWFQVFLDDFASLDEAVTFRQELLNEHRGSGMGLVYQVRSEKGKELLGKGKQQ